jgi:hypothetical protein
LVGQSFLSRSGLSIEKTVYEENEGMIRPEAEVDDWMARSHGSLEQTFLQVSALYDTFHEVLIA